VEVRSRRDDDLDALVALGARMRAVEGYPPDSAGFYEHPRLAGWVGSRADELVGHVALHERSAAPVNELACEATGLPLEQLGVLARLFVAIECRRGGLARRLVDLTVGEAHALRRQPVLDVNVLFEPAIALYESCGWTRVGDVRFAFTDAGRRHEAHSYVYVGPPPPSSP
jgi:GNAT superfamily N-acetyltransferase